MRKILIAMACLALLAVPAAADSVSYSFGTYSQSGIGDSIGSAYDQIDFVGSSGVTNTGSVFKIGDLTFTVGVNCAAVPCHNPNTGSVNTLGSVGGNLGLLNIPWDVNISFSDTITLFGSNNYFGSGPSGALYLKTFGIGPVTLGNGGSATYSVYGVVPEPGTMALLGTGLLGFGFRRFRKN